MKQENKNIESLDVEEVKSLIEVSAERNADSIFIRIENPRKLVFWVAIFYKKEKILEKENISDFAFSDKNLGVGNYFINIHYMWAGELVNQDYTVGLEDKKLNVSIDGPSVITPGSSHNFTINITDYKQNAMPNTDITVNIATKKFNNDYNVKYYNTPQWGQILHANYTGNQKLNLDFIEKLDFNYFRYIYNLDSLKYYQFLYPANGMYQDSIPCGLKTEFAPFILKNGALETIHMIYLDNLPLYFKLSSKGQRYSFAVKPGKHKITIRTTNNDVTIPEFNIVKGHKNLLSLDLLNLPATVINSPAKNIATSKELLDLEKYSMAIMQEPTKTPVYVSQGTRYWEVRNGYNKIGPIYAGGGIFKNYGEPNTLNFIHKGAYSYVFEKNQITATSRMPLKKVYFSNELSQPSPYLYDTALTVEELDKQYARYVDTDLPLPSMYDLNYSTGFEKGTLKLILENSKPRIFLKHILLLKIKEPNFLKIYPSSYQTLFNLEPDTFKIILLFNDNLTLEVRDIKVQKNGINLEKINLDSIKLGDEKTIFFNQKVLEMIYGSSIKAGQEIKEKLVGINNYNYFNDNFDNVLRGHVVDSEGIGLPGVSVTIKGTTKGVVTDANGNFEILCPSKGVLVCSFIGFKSQETIITNENNLTTVLLEDASMLEEVIVVGYGIFGKKSLTASVSNILQGRVAGVNINDKSLQSPRFFSDDLSSPGNTTNVSIRGYTTIPSRSSVLIIKNGKIFTGTLSEDDKASMDFLSGEAAVALYGSMAEAGVIIINSKKKNFDDVDKNFLSEIRSNFKDRAYWNPCVKTNADGKATFTVKFPDDITQWKTQVIAINGRKYTGLGTSQTKVFKPMAVSLSLAPFLVQGDSTEIYGKTRNLLSDTITAITGFETSKGDTITFENSKIANTLLQSTTIKANNLDSIKVKFFARNTAYADAEVRNIPVLTRGSEEHFGAFFNLEKDTVLMYVPRFGKNIKLKIFSDPLEVCRQEIRNLHEYQYACNEQLASKLIGYLLDKKISTIKNESFKYEKAIRKCINNLERNINESNSWGWWEKSSQISWITEHVVLALDLAKTMGYEIDYKPIKNINSSSAFEFQTFDIDKQLTFIENTYRNDSDQAKALLGRVTLKKVDFNAHLKMQILNQKLGLPVVLDTILKYEKKTALGSIYFGEIGFDPEFNAVFKTVKVYKLLKAIGKQDEKLKKIKQYFFETKGTQTWRNTYEKALILEALVPDMISDTTFRNATLGISCADFANQNINKFPFEASYKASNPVSLNFKGSGPLFFSISESYLNPNPEKISENFEVNTKFENSSKDGLNVGEPNKIITTLKVNANSSYVMLSIPIIGSSTLSSNQPFPANLASVFHKEILKDRIIYYINNLNKGTYVFETVINPSFKGYFTLNNAKAELMYFPFIMGREGIKSIEVK